MSASSEMRRRSDKKLDTIIRLHREGAKGTRVASALSERLDTLIRSIAHSLHSPHSNLLSFVALGGYGRKELCLASDTDIMVLLSEESDKPKTVEAMQEFLHRLLDLGLDVGHSFRTIDECLEMSHGDFESWISLLESRFICGNRSAYRQLLSTLKQFIKTSDRPAFVEKLTDLLELRHNKYGNSTKLLEPNIKNSAGGLRDLHTAFWLMRGIGRAKLPESTPTASTTLIDLLDSPELRRLFPRAFLKESKQAFDFLLRTRNEMHLQARSLHDTLEFAFQTQIAKGLHYRATSNRRSVERFMQDYYGATRTVAQLAERVLSWAHDEWTHVPRPAAVRTLDRVFLLRSQKIHLRKQPRAISNPELLQAFLFRKEHGVEFSYRLEDTIHRCASRCSPLRSIPETQLFRQLLNRPTGVSESILKMNGLGLLARWIPEWKPMVAFFQHNQYHYYTADEHTLVVISNAEGLSDSASSFGEVFRSLPRKDALYLACLLHDIAKPLHVRDHEVRGVRLTKQILHRLRYKDVLDDVCFLVRNHLLMEQVAFRRNLHDPQTIIDFAEKFENRRQLDYLYVLTYADLSAVNKNVWTEWKELLLSDLYRKTREVLDGKMTGVQVHEQRAQQHSAAVDALVRALSRSFSEEVIRAHLRLMDSPGYLSTFSPDEIGEHLRAIQQAASVTNLFHHWSDFTEITVIARDAPFALSKFCGVLSANDANIFDAHIFTRTDGIIIDKFRVVEFVSKASLTEEHCRKIQSEMRDVVEQKLDIVHLMERHRAKWKRRTVKLNPNVRVDVEFEDHPRFTIIDVYSADTLGFLHKVTETMSRLGLNISFAKIATRVDGIVDTFYVLDREGGRIDDPHRRELIKTEILKTIRDLFELELVVSVH